MWTKEQVRMNGGAEAVAIADLLLETEIHVTKQMIREGSKECCNSCPVALAIRETLPLSEVYVDYWMIEIDSIIRFDVPEKVERFMRRFDGTINRESMSGIKFTLTTLQTFFCSPRAK